MLFHAFRSKLPHHFRNTPYNTFVVRARMLASSGLFDSVRILRHHEREANYFDHLFVADEQQHYFVYIVELKQRFYVI